MRQRKNKYMHNAKCCGLVSMIAKILLIVRGLNWGLVGVGALFTSNWNLVNLIFGFSPTLEMIVYILLGVAAVVEIFNFGCKKCGVGDASVNVPGVDQNM